MATRLMVHAGNRRRISAVFAVFVFFWFIAGNLRVWEQSFSQATTFFAFLFAIVCVFRFLLHVPLSTYH